MTGDTLDEIVARLRAEHGWTDAGVVVWGRAECRSEYCDADLLECRAAYKAYQYDHILPQSKYRQLCT